MHSRFPREQLEHVGRISSHCGFVSLYLFLFHFLRYSTFTLLLLQLAHPFLDLLCAFRALYSGKLVDLFLAPAALKCSGRSKTISEKFACGGIVSEAQVLFQELWWLKV